VNITVFINRLKTALEAFALWTGSASLFQAEGPAMAKARLTYVLSDVVRAENSGCVSGWTAGSSRY